MGPLVKIQTEITSINRYSTIPSCGYTYTLTLFYPSNFLYPLHPPPFNVLMHPTSSPPFIAPPPPTSF